ncbi:aldose epimerase family protein [Lacticaseibacillus nasuensis]|uniref:aldose epimerase family protein n=1 Tax=Lacticaseibacillus nasuensis TaxID=944671 RepID=UPI0022466642|nr:aldose epimerase family protein [Lacticaseibacillus nasuensis]MCX2456274.1 galactose mutarotase [Lacticaseibacillus nasuensis]
MGLTTEAFGTVRGAAVTAYTIENKHGVRMTVLDYGATWYKLEVPTAAGHQNLLLSSPDISGYADPGSYHSKTIGRVAGRIGQGHFKQNGQVVNLPANEGTTTLHGGPNGFSTRMWQADASADAVKLTLHVTSADDGFPGDVDVTVTYTLGEDDFVTIDYAATSSAPTLFNPTNHAYWNLNAGDDTIQNHLLTLNSAQHYEVQANKVPTGELLANLHSGFDFSRVTNLGDALAEMQWTEEKGFDDIFAIPAHATDEPVATLTQGAITVQEFSDRNALVVFTANKFGTELDFGEKTSRPYIGIAMEAQTAPSAIDDPKFGDITLSPDQPRHEQIRYHFSY